MTGGYAGYRYTLTEGDFHHLKNARLTHLHLPPLKIVTIHECDSSEASATTMPHPTAPPKTSLAIFQVSMEGLAATPGLGGRDPHTRLAGGTFPTLWAALYLRTGREAGCGTQRVAGPSTPPHLPVLFDLSLLPPPPGSVPQPPGKALTGRSVGPSSALPGDPYNPATGPADFEISSSSSSDSGEGTSVRAPMCPFSLPVPLQDRSACGLPLPQLSLPQPGPLTATAHKWAPVSWGSCPWA